MAANPQNGKLHVSLSPPPCVPGSVGTAEIRYFAPSEAVWTAAHESGLVVLLPIEQARMQARLAHNYELLAKQRDKVASDCEAIVAMHNRFTQPQPDGQQEALTMTPEQAERFAERAAQTQVDIKGLLFRLRWSNLYEDGIAHGRSMVDINMMTMDQTRFEDPPGK